jgi:hypothetical protein
MKRSAGQPLGERAAGLEVGEDDHLVRVQDLRGLGHEVDAREADDVGLRRAASCESWSESPRKSATSWISESW